MTHCIDSIDCATWDRLPFHLRRIELFDQESTAPAVKVNRIFPKCEQN